MSRILPLFVMALALVVWSGTAIVADDKPNDQDKNAQAKGDTHEGTIVSVTENKLTMKAKGDDAEHTHTLAANAKIWCDGKECKLEDLKPGLKVRVTTMKDNKDVAVRIEALDKDKDFPKKDRDRDNDSK